MSRIKLSDLRDYWKNVSDWVKGIDSDAIPKVADENIKQELELIKQQQKEIINRLDGTFDTRPAESYIEYRVTSTEELPEASTDEKGAILIVMDTGNIYMNYGDGTWGEF